MITYRSFVGLDVHARTIVGCAIDMQTGEVVYRRFGYDLAEVASWVGSLPGVQTATYEAGPTGFGLFRLLTGAGIECVVAAPSKLQRPSGDRVKTDLLTELASWCSGWCVRDSAGAARFRRHDQRRGYAAGVVRAGGAAARLA